MLEGFEYERDPYRYHCQQSSTIVDRFKALEKLGSLWTGFIHRLKMVLKIS